jgi:hypothetical protein
MVARSTPSKVRTIFEGEVAEVTLGILDCPQEEGSFKMLKTLDPELA